jgi:enamine deaminase RidA (YjgF/YER057c/UK114 family)
MTVEANVRRLQLSLPETPRPLGDYVPAVEAGNLLFVSGMLPMENGAAAFVGRVGQELTIESGRRAAQLAVANALAVARDAVSLNRLAGVVRLGYMWRVPLTLKSTRPSPTPLLSY